MGPSAIVRDCPLLWGCLRTPVWAVLASGFLILSAVGLYGAVAAVNPAAEVRAAITDVVELRSRIEARIRDPKFQGARWGIQVWALDAQAAVFEHASEQVLVPASNTKLFTAALALDRLGPDFRIRTSVLASRSLGRSGRVEGGLALVGRGDPGFGAGTKNLSLLGEQLAARGLRSVSGDVLADARFFNGSLFGSGWMVEDLDAYYSPEVSALSYNDNVADWVVVAGAKVRDSARLFLVQPESGLVLSNFVLTAEVAAKPTLDARRFLGRNEGMAWGEIPLGGAPLTNTLTVHDPAAWCARALIADLKQRDIRWRSGQVKTLNSWGGGAPLGPDLSAWQELAFVESAPLSELVREMMKPSNNLHAQLLFLQVGAREGESVPFQTTEVRAVGAMRRFLRPIVKGGRLPILEEGSGLSRRHGVSASQIVDLLTHMHGHASARAFRDALPIAGVDGTLRTRMRGTAAYGNVRAKTGTLRGVNTLSGYLTTAGGESWAFSILLNDYQAAPGQRPAREEVDAVAVLLAEFAGRLQ